MIHGKLENLKDYIGYNSHLEEVVNFLNTANLDELPLGLTVLNDYVTVTKLNYVGKEEAKANAELHYNHLDLQILTEGSEISYYDELTSEFDNFVNTPYNNEKDVIKYTANLRHSVIMDTENFTLFTPTDVHKPCVKLNENPITKLVIKILV